MKFLKDLKMRLGKSNFYYEILFALSLSLLTYVAFYGNFLKHDYNFWSSEGQITDAQAKHLPARTYLYEKIVHEHVFPFWTEKMYSGFPIYADPENAYLNPANILSVILFGPLTSYKVLHLLEYLIGSLSLFILLRRKGIGILGYFLANVIFYFNTFLIDHQIHYNMIMALLLFPLIILLGDLFIEKKQLRYIFLESLVIANAVLWGHMQSVAIMMMGLFAYMIVYSYKKIQLSTFCFFFITLMVFVGIETLPQILPTHQVLAQSSRGEGTDYLKGSLNPRMAIFAFVPYLLGESASFVGRDISTDFSYNEVYFYSGIGAVILSVLAVLFLKKSREVIVAFVFVWIFLLFGFMESNHLFPKGTPLVTYLREWQRTVVLFTFGIALLAGTFIEKIKDVSLKNLKTGSLYLFSIVGYFLLLVGITGGKISKKISAYTSFEHIKDYIFSPVVETVAINLVFALLVLLIAKKISGKIFSGILVPIKLIIATLVFFDLFYFSSDVVNLRLQDVSNYKLASIPAEFSNKRVIFRDLNILGAESLYYDNWSPLGTSQLKDSDYVDYYGKLGLNLRGVTSSIIELPKNLDNLSDTGIYAISQHAGVTILNDRKLELIKNNLEGSYLEKKEGRIVMQINNPSDTIINTYLKYNNDWVVKVDGQKTEITKNGIFFDFPLEQGKHTVEINYHPRAFFQGIYLSLILLLVAVIVYNLFKKQINESVLERKI